MLGIGAELTGLNSVRIIYNLSSNMGIVGLLGFEYNSTSVEVAGIKNDESNWAASICAGLAYTMPTPVLPMFLEGDLLLGTTTSDQTYFELDAYFGAKATIVKSFEVAAQLGLGLNYMWWDNTDNNMTYDYSVLSLGFKTKVYATWYFL